MSNGRTSGIARWLRVLRVPALWSSSTLAEAMQRGLTAQIDKCMLVGCSGSSCSRSWKRLSLPPPPLPLLPLATCALPGMQSALDFLPAGYRSMTASQKTRWKLYIPPLLWNLAWPTQTAAARPSPGVCTLCTPWQQRSATTKAAALQPAVPAGAALMHNACSMHGARRERAPDSPGQNDSSTVGVHICATAQPG